MTSNTMTFSTLILLACLYVTLISVSNLTTLQNVDLLGVMSRLSDLAGVLRGLQKVTRSLNAQRERSAGDAWLQSSIREGVERAMTNKPSPEQLG